jgi:hypothetical protein
MFPRIVAFCMLCAVPAHADQPSQSSKESRVSISLFGQPCVLSGPQDETTLRAIHAVSPEQMPTSPEAGQAAGLAERVKKVTGLPPGLDSYRDQLTRRLEGQAAFEAALVAARKSGKLDELQAAAKKHLATRKAEAFNALLKKNFSKEAPSRWNPSQLESLTELWNESAPPHPEEEFHRVIRRIGVKYTCSYDEGDGEGEAESD